MADSVQTGTARLLHASELARTLVLRSARNGMRFTSFGESKPADVDLERIVEAVPAAIAPALADRAFYFVPLVLPEAADAMRLAGPEPEQTLVSAVYTSELSDEAVCHRNVALAGSPSEAAHEGVFISARLLQDNFALAFEFFINVGHAFASAAGIPESFAALAWSQALAEVRGETSQDAWEARVDALAGRLAAPAAKSGRSFGERVRPLDKRPGLSPMEASSPAGETAASDEKAKLEFLESAFADALAIYQLSLAVDFDYSELREREYPLLAPAALAERLRLMAQLFPPNPGYEFSIRYRRRA